MANDLVTMDAAQKPSGGGVRGSSYPAISLEAAVKRAKQLWDRERKNPAPMEAVADHWGYSATSSGLRTAVAALISFGLVTDSGSGGHRQIQLSPWGLDIVLDTPQRANALRQAVTSPKIYADILAQWGADNLPSDQTLKVYLLRHKNFNPKSVDGFIKDFKDSIGFSGLEKAAIIPADISESAEAIDMQDGSVAAAHRDLGPSNVLTRGARESELRGNLTKETQFRLLVTGAIGPKEIRRLIKILETQAEILDEDSE